jgi:hypothetical protein
VGLRAAGRVWQARAHDIGNFQSRLLLTVFYFTVMAPFAVAVRLFSDPLQRRPRMTGWNEWTHQPTDLAGARRQY